MRILYVAAKHDYGRPEQGLSFEHYNFYDSLANLGHDILYVDLLGEHAKRGRAALSALVERAVTEQEPDLLFVCLFKDELDPEVVQRISRSGRVPTLNWFCDDHWRFDNFSARWAPNFNWVVTTALSALPKYAAIGYENVVKSQWACNHVLYAVPDTPLRYDVSFVGQPHGNRRLVIDSLREAGIPVSAWGAGWENGRLTQQEMIEVFAASRINLNLSNASVPLTNVEAASVREEKGEPRGQSVLRRAAARCVGQLPFGTAAMRLRRTLFDWAALRTSGAAPERPAIASRRALLEAPAFGEQIKGRNFEVPGCGGFLLTGHAEDLESYFEIGREVVTFRDPSELIEKARYYLEHEEERCAIAEAGRRRTLREHTYAHRFGAIFDRMSLSAVPQRTDGQGHPLRGETIELT